MISLSTETLSELIDNAIKEYQDHPFCGFFDEQAYTFKEIALWVDQLTGLLRHNGLQKGDRIAILGDNSPAWGAVYLAGVVNGLIVVPILPDFPATDIRHIIRHSGARLLFSTSRQFSKLEENENSSLPNCYLLEELDWRSETPHLKPFRNIPVQRIGSPSPDDLAAIIYTSGTTGHSKGVMLSHRNLVSDIINSVARFHIDYNDHFLSILPMAHTYECTSGFLIPLYVGAPISYIHGLPTPKTLLAAMQKVRPRALLTVPLVIEKIYRNQILAKFNQKPITRHLLRFKKSRKLLHRIAGKKLLQLFGNRLRFMMFGGAGLSPDVEQFLQDAHFPYSVGYGLTETSPIIAINPLGKVKPFSVGLPIADVQIRIFQCDENGIGEIIVKGPVVMQGYYQNPQANEQVFLPDGWLRTGDLGYIDEEGYIFIKGRLKNVIIGSSGKNIYPEIIEQLLCQTPYILQAIVYDDSNRLSAKVYPDYDQIDQYLLNKQITTDQSKTALKQLLEEIRLSVNSQLPAYSQLIKIHEQIEPFDMTPTKKVKRYLYLNPSKSQ